jgi:hypothetical protein
VRALRDLYLRQPEECYYMPQQTREVESGLSPGFVTRRNFCAMMLDGAASQINYVASQPIRHVIASLSRTEDVRFSPNGRRLAVAGFVNNSITVFGISIARSGKKKKVILNDVTEISSAYLNRPHGLDFVDNDKLIVANREGLVCVFELPKLSGSYRLEPITVLLSWTIDPSDDAVTALDLAAVHGDSTCNSSLADLGDDDYRLRGAGACRRPSSSRV